MGRAADSENTSTAGLADDTATNSEILFTIGSYAEPAMKPFITVSYSARRVPIGHKPVVIRITADYLKTVGEGPDDELPFCSSVWALWSPYCNTTSKRMQEPIAPFQMQPLVNNHT